MTFQFTQYEEDIQSLKHSYVFEQGGVSIALRVNEENFGTLTIEDLEFRACVEFALLDPTEVSKAFTEFMSILESNIE